MAVSVLFALASAPAAAMDWNATHFISSQLSLSNGDGANSSSDDEDTTLSLRSTVGTNIRATGRRLTFATNSSLSLINRTSGGAADLNQNIRALASLELWKNRLFVDGNITSTRELISSQSPVSGGDAATDDDNRVSVTSASISPYWQQRYGSWAQTLARYRHTEVISGSDGGADSRNDSVELQLVGGSAFQPWRPALISEWQNIDERADSEDNESDLTRYSVSFTNELALSRRYSVTASVGYDEVEASSQDRDLSGVNWSVGVNGQPGPRSSFEFSFGQRYGDPAINGNASYAITSNLTFRVNATHSLSSGLQGLVSDSNLVTVDPVTGELVTPEGLPAGFGNSGVDSEISLRQSISATLVGDYGRNRIIFSSFAEQRDFDDGEENIVRVRGVYTRELSRDLSASLASFYNQTRPQDTATTHTVNGRFDLNYRIGQRTSLFGSYSYTNRRSVDESLEYSDHVASIGARMSF